MTKEISYYDYEVSYSSDGMILLMIESPLKGSDCKAEYLNNTLCVKDDDTNYKFHNMPRRHQGSMQKKGCVYNRFY